MGIRSLTLQQSNTKATLTFTGNTAATYAEDSMVIANGVHVICTSDDLVDRKQITFKSRPATFDAKTSSYAKSKNAISIARPVTLADGKVSFLTLRMELEAHPEVPEDLINMVVNHAAELALDPGYRPFWLYGAKS